MGPIRSTGLILLVVWVPVEEGEAPLSRPQSRLSSFPAARGLIIERVRRKHKGEQFREGPGFFRDLRYVQLIP